VLKNILENKLFIFLFVVVTYLLIHYTNNWLTEFLYLVPGAHLVHIPSGFKLLFVLVAGWIGAIGIGTAALIAALMYSFPDQYTLGVQLALINGLAPLITRRLVIDNFASNEDLSGITSKQLMLLGLVFAFLNSGLNQVVLYWNGVHQNILDGILVMFIGDITGSYIVFLMLKLISKKLSKVDESESG
jgi:hypothetical protein